ncbi:MAG: hypothetical protein WAL63_03960 [Solirubrobacteraceae bacterium]
MESHPHPARRGSPYPGGGPLPRTYSHRCQRVHWIPPGNRSGVAGALERRESAIAELNGEL